MPKQRRLDADAKEEAIKFLKLKANKKLIQNHLISATGKTVTLKDIHNLGTKIPKCRNDFQELVKEMKTIQGMLYTWLPCYYYYYTEQVQP